MALGQEVANDEAGLAQRAVAGDGDAFAELYSRYEKRTYNLCLRIVGSEDEAADATQEAFVSVLRRLPKLEGRDLAFGSYIFTSARHACYDLIERRKRAEPSDDIAEGAIPVGGGVGGGGMGFDPGDPEDDPERNVLLEARQEEIREANLQLPERQREVLVLRELEQLSYDEIADIMEMNRNSVAQLISRARINLRDALRGTALASIATSSADCERAIALLAADQDREPAEDDGWLRSHVAECETCRLSREAMEEAGVSYRAWLPVAAAPVLFRETMARAEGAVGEDWSDVVARHEAKLANGAGRGLGQRLGWAGGGAAAGAASAPESARASLRRHRRRDLALIGGLAAVILLVVLAATVQDGTQVEDVQPAAEDTQAVSDSPAPEKPAAEKEKPKKEKQANKDQGPKATGAPAGPTDNEPPDAEPVESAGEPAGPVAQGRDRERQSRRSGSTRDQTSGGGGESLAGEDPPVVKDPPADPPVVTDPPADPPVVTDPPIDPPDPPTRPTCGIPGTPPCQPPRPPRQPPVP
jgi:RNA polymerase sigma-70 factor (ECF subfamily)